MHGDLSLPVYVSILMQTTIGSSLSIRNYARVGGNLSVFEHAMCGSSMSVRNSGVTFCRKSRLQVEKFH